MGLPDSRLVRLVVVHIRMDVGVGMRKPVVMMGLELVPLMEASGFSDIETAPAKFQILGLSILAFVRGNARKG
jgi:hypothetical protein